MAKITYNTHDSKTHTIDVQNGLTVMEGAVQNDIPFSSIKNLILDLSTFLLLKTYDLLYFLQVPHAE